MKLILTKLQNGMDFWYRSNDKYIGERIALGKYEEYESLLILRNVNKNSVVVDVGANIGYYTLLLAKVCKKVYAFEPDKNSFLILKKNIEENNLKNVVLINKAVGDTREKVELIVDKNNFGNTRINLPKSLFDKRDLIGCVRLDDVIKEKVDLVKIDVQGHEPQVINGAKNLIKKYSPILFLEYNSDFVIPNYKYIFTIDYWFYILRLGIIIDKKIGYTDLLLTNENISLWERYRNLQWKKVIKKIINL